VIVFETIAWKNFLSTGDQWTDIQLDDADATLIVGSNGAGKSTMLDALCFALFNKPFRKISKSQLVNSINEKGTKVQVTFSIGRDEYRVFRAIKPNIFELYKNNKLVDQDAATKDTQKYLEQSILKLNFKSFTQVVILGSSTFVPFMQLTAPNRREVIEDLLDIKIFSHMNTILKDRYKVAYQQSKDCSNLLSIAEERLKSQEKLIKSLREVNSVRRQEKEDKVVQNKALIESIEQDQSQRKDELSVLDKQLIDTESHQYILSDLKSKTADLKSEMKRVSKEMKFLKSHDTCPTCTQTISTEFKEGKIESLTTSGVDYAKKLKKEQKAIEDVVSILDEANMLSMKAHELRTEISTFDRDLIRLDSENLSIEKELSNLVAAPKIEKEEHVLKTLVDDFEDTKIDCGKVAQKIDEYHTVRSLLQDSGIKSRIIKKYVPIFNQLINKYLHSMDFFVNFTLDEEFNEEIKSRFRDDFCYASFSEGEKQKIDLALLFTWREVARMKNSAATNLLILDEVFDSSLDADSTNALLSILGTLGNNTNIFVISHKGDILIEKFHRTLRFEKINDFSKLVDDL
jgi:DNA repair exonuclease SbcCD ATPase subunit|tara:strand:- start:3639 stop:5357 length:1719 start_codon:yes stop_codon:yes gene_type:complete